MKLTEKSEEELLQHMINNPGWDKTAEQYISRWRKVYRDRDVPHDIAKKYGRVSRALTRYRKLKKEMRKTAK